MQRRRPLDIYVKMKTDGYLDICSHDNHGEREKVLHVNDTTSSSYETTRLEYL